MYHILGSINGKNQTSSILKNNSIFFRFCVSVWNNGLNEWLMPTMFQLCKILFGRLLISCVVIQMISGFVLWRDHIKFHIFSFEFFDILLFLRLCCIMHQVIQIFCFGDISLSLPVILSSDFCLTEHVSNITISASDKFSVYENQQFNKIALILALSE